MRRTDVNEYVIVWTSSFAKANCTLIRDDGKAMVVDALPYPDEQEAFVALVGQVGAEVVRLLATHIDWDHAIGASMFPDLPLTCAPTTADRFTSGRHERLGEMMREFDEAHYVERPASQYEVPRFEVVPESGMVTISTREVEIIPTAGHTDDGLAAYVPWAGALISGDYLSPCEMPRISPSGSVPAYLETLEKLRPCLELVETVVPGHGYPCSAARALEVLYEDRAYLEALTEPGANIVLPPGRDDEEQYRVHHEMNFPRANGLELSGGDLTSLNDSRVR